MINYATFLFLKKNKVSTQQLHLFEHCIAKKISTLIEETFNDKGIIFNAETYTDSSMIELFCSKLEYIEQLVDLVKGFRFSDKDLKLINHERDVILHEVSYVDISDEEKLLYQPISYFSDNNIDDLYSNDIEMTNILELFNRLIKSVRVSFFNSGKLNNHKKHHLDLSKKVKIKSKWKIINNKIIGTFIIKNYNLKYLVLGKLISFIYGQSNESIIYSKLLMPYDLYLGYTMDVPIETNFQTLFYIETNANTKKLFNENPLILKDLEISMKIFKKMRSSFKTFVLMTDPLLLEFNRYLIRTEIKESINMRVIADVIDDLTYNDVVDFWKVSE